MLPKIILKCAFLLTIPRVNPFFVLKINNLDEDELVSTVINVVNKSTARDAGNGVLNNIAFRGMDLLNYLGSRRSGNHKKYLNRRLVKRIVPHGYEVDDVEFDEKFQTIYKPLVRIHKKKPTVDATTDGKDEKIYELVLVIDGDQYRDVTKVLPDDLLLKPFTIDNMDIQYFPNGKNMDDTIGIQEIDDNDKFTKYKSLDQITHLNAKHLLQDKFRDDGLLRPRKKKLKIDSSSRIPMKFKKAYKTKMLDQARLVQRHREREYNPHEAHNAKAIPKKMKWFGPVEHLVSKQFQSKERLEKQKEANTEESKSEISKINNKSVEMDPVKKALASLNKTTKHQNIEKYYEAIKKLMKIAKKYDPNPYPIERQNKIKNFVNIPSIYEINDRFMEIYKENGQKPVSVKRKPFNIGKHTSGKFDLFDLVGILHSKQYTRDNSNVLYSKSVQAKYKLPEPINQVIQIENEQFKNAKSVRDVHELLESIGNLNKKLLKPNDRKYKLDKADKELDIEREPNLQKRKNKLIKTDLQTSKEYNLFTQKTQPENLFDSKERNSININDLDTSNNYKLLSQIGSKFDKPLLLARDPEHRKLKNIDDIDMLHYNNVFGQLAEPKADKLYDQAISSVKLKKKWNSRLDKLNLSQLAHLKAEMEKERHLRMHVVNEKSGEEGFLLPKFSWDHTEVTTEPVKSAVPQYPFYNYWTYEKTVHQDKCKGSLIQLGQLCIKDE